MIKKNLLYNKIEMNELLKKEFFGELGDAVGALRDLSVPSKGQARGHYLRSY